MPRFQKWFLLQALFLFPYYGYSSPVKKAAEFLGVPYRDDGVQNQWGQYTTFNSPGKIFPGPGFNCSGFLVSVTRALLGKGVSLEQARHDRKADSGPGALLGHDWDFGLDLILNLTDGWRLGPVLPGLGGSEEVDKEKTVTQKGFNIHDLKLWDRVLPKLIPGYLYYVAISKPYRKRGYRLIYYHVALIIPDKKGGIWFMHSTRKAGSHRINLALPRGMDLLQREFARSNFGDKFIYIIKTRLSDSKKKHS